VLSVTTYFLYPSPLSYFPFRFFSSWMKCSTLSCTRT